MLPGIELNSKEQRSTGAGLWWKEALQVDVQRDAVVSPRHPTTTSRPVTLAVVQADPHRYHDGNVQPTARAGPATNEY